MLTLTEQAVRKLGELMTQQPEPAFGLRVGVGQGGCHGYEYRMGFADRAEPGDWIGEFGGIKVLVDLESAPVLDGVTIDYVESLQTSGFTISNPRAVKTCGCGKAFDTEESAAKGEGHHS